MHSPDFHFYDVIVVGAGPVGLFLACELRLSGCSVLLLEKAEDTQTPLKSLPFGLRGLSVPTVECFDRRDLLDELLVRVAKCDTPSAAHWMRKHRRPSGHFAGIQFFYDQIDTEQWSYRLPGPIGSIAVDIASIEDVLAIRAERCGVEIRRGYGVEAVQQTADAVTVVAGDITVSSRWLVGCDGGRSTVRKAAGIGFTGTEPEFTGYSVQVELHDPAALNPGQHYTTTGMYTYTAPGTIAMVDFDGGIFHRTKPTREHIEQVLRKITEVDVGVAALLLATTWTDRAFQAVDYRAGRIFLAGDAAHVHSPLGGQGLNLGLGDAMNLGWKLAATIQGDAPDGLLDTYGAERRPVGAQVLDWSRAQVALMRPSRSSRALEAIIRDLMTTRDGATYFAERVLGVGIRYDLGDPHPLVGRSVPDFELMGDSRVNKHLRKGLGLLLDFEGNASLRELAGRWSNRIVYVTGSGSERLGMTAALVRPDGVVAWACETVADLKEAELRLTKWFGAPSASS